MDTQVKICIYIGAGLKFEYLEVDRPKEPWNLSYILLLDKDRTVRDHSGVSKVV